MLLETLHVLIVVWTDAGRSDVWPHVPTTTLRDLSEDGLELTRFVSMPVGSATVYSMLFGEYPFRNGNVNGFSWEGDGPLVPDVGLEARSLAEAAKAAGYSVALHGKWGLGGNDLGTGEELKAVTPQLHGFSTWRAGLGGNVASGLGTSYTSWERIDDGVTELSGQWIDEAIAEEWTQWWLTTQGPRFSVVWFSAGHSPWTETPPDSALPPGYQPYRFSYRGRYEAMIVALDHLTERMLRHVDFADTVVVLFTTNGTPDHRLVSTTPNRGKRSTYDTGILVPAAIRGPGIRQGTTDELASPVDLWATLAELVGIAPPPHGSDSVSFAPVLADAEARSRRRYVFSQDEATGAVRTRTHKLMLDGTTERLFELESDPDEQRPLDPDAYPNRELVRNLRFWLANPGSGMVQDQASAPPRPRLPQPRELPGARTPLETER